MGVLIFFYFIYLIWYIDFNVCFFWVCILFLVWVLFWEFFVNLEFWCLDVFGWSFEVELFVVLLMFEWIVFKLFFVGKLVFLEFLVLEFLEILGVLFLCFDIWKFFCVVFELCFILIDFGSVMFMCFFLFWLFILLFLVDVLFCLVDFKWLFFLFWGNEFFLFNFVFLLFVVMLFIWGVFLLLSVFFEFLVNLIEFCVLVWLLFEFFVLRVKLGDLFKNLLGLDVVCFVILFIFYFDICFVIWFEYKSFK